MKTGKRYSEAAKLVEKTKTYDLEEAVALVKKTASAKSVSYTHLTLPTICSV